jgi:urease accessory protein UreE
MLQVFRSLPVAREVYPIGALPALASNYARDTLTLGWEERLKGRARRRSDGGIEFGTTLPRGLVLRQGDCLVLDDPRAVIVIVEKAEPVCVITPASQEDWARFAYFIGNSHQPMMVAGGAIVCPDVLGMTQVLDYHQIPYTAAVRTFTPITMNGEAFTADHLHPSQTR